MRSGDFLRRRVAWMIRRDQLIAAVTNIVPAGGALGVAVSICSGQAVHGFEIGLFIAGYVLTLAGLEIGYHRYFSHRAFKTSPRFAALLAILGATSFQGGVIWWVATHRRHHAHTDREADPHSPRTAPGAGLWQRANRLWHAHIGWMFDPGCLKPPGWERLATDLFRDPTLFRLHIHYAYWGMLGLALPAVAGWLWYGDLRGMLNGLLWGGLLRLFAANHMMYCANSLCHAIGRQSIPCEDDSRNLTGLALLSLGLSLHNNHHCFPSAAILRFRWYQIDPAGMLIGLLEKFGVVWDVRRIDKTRLAGLTGPADSH
jgi:stearoyl-CoA desaturase (delta-9 desaturase)